MSPGEERSGSARVERRHEDTREWTSRRYGTIRGFSTDVPGMEPVSAGSAPFGWPFTSPCSVAHTAICALDEEPSFDSAAATYLSTVRSPMPRVPAMAPLALPLRDQGGVRARAAVTAIGGLGRLIGRLRSMPAQLVDARAEPAASPGSAIRCQAPAATDRARSKARRAGRESTASQMEDIRAQHRRQRSGMSPPRPPRLLTNARAPNTTAPASRAPGP